MEDKKVKKVSLTTVILLLIIVAIISVGATYVVMNEKKNTVNSNGELSTSEGRDTYIKDENNKVTEDNTTNSNTPDKDIAENSESIISSIFTATEKNKTQGVKYSFDEKVANFSINIKDGKPYINAYNTDHTSIKDLATYSNIDENQVKIKTNEYTEITGFSKKVMDVHIGCIGQDIVGTIFVFLMEDGTVEYSTLSNMLSNVSTQGKIEGLNNIVGLYSSSVTDVGGGGYSTVVVLDSENYFYNLNNYIH